MDSFKVADIYVPMRSYSVLRLKRLGCQKRSVIWLSLFIRRYGAFYLSDAKECSPDLLHRLNPEINMNYGTALYILIAVETLIANQDYRQR